MFIIKYYYFKKGENTKNKKNSEKLKKVEKIKKDKIIASSLPEEIVGVDKNMDIVKLLKKEMNKYDTNRNNG